MLAAAVGGVDRSRRAAGGLGLQRSAESGGSGAGFIENIVRSTQLAGYNRLALLLFRLDGRQLYGINVLKVQEVVQRPPITPMPATHPFVTGVAEVREQTVPIIDMRRAMGVDGDGELKHVIVTECNRAVQGFLVRSVERIVHVDVETVLPPPCGTHDSGHLTAITQFGDELIEIIDVERILAEVVGTPASLSQQSLASLGERARSRGFDIGLLNGRCILVVDDSQVARSQINQVLQQLGIETVLLGDGREALKHLQAIADGGDTVGDRVLMVISDVEMPDMDGYALTAEIRRDERLRGLYVMLHTSLSGVFNNTLVKKVGADVFIPKFDSDDLAQRIIERLKAER